MANRYSTDLPFAATAKKSIIGRELDDHSRFEADTMIALEPVILVIGSEGQIGSELVPELRDRFGESQVIASDLRPCSGHTYGPFAQTDVTDRAALRNLIREYRVSTIYHLASLLSVTGEGDPNLAWRVNLEGLRNVIEVSREQGVRKIFWPSSIAAFGPHTPRTGTPQFTIMDPETMYGITKVTGELLCNYAFTKSNLDIRCLRYPGIISWKTPPGGGTTDFAVAMLYKALSRGSYTCYLRPDTTLPMMYIPDVVRATVNFMDVPCERLRTHLGYNLGAMSFTPQDLEHEIRKHIPEFRCTYKPDERQRIADSWPRSVDDASARQDWGWEPRFTLKQMVEDMLRNINQLSRSSAECNVGQ